MIEGALVVGIDANATSVAYSVFYAEDGELATYRSVTVQAEPKNRPYELAEALADDLEVAGVRVDHTVFYIEQPFGFNVSGIAAVERTTGVLLYLLHPAQELINVSTWKKACGVPPVPRIPRGTRKWTDRRDAALATLQDQGPKITSKTQIKARCLELYPELPPDLRPADLYDAVLIGRAGYLINCGEYVE